MGLVCAKTVRAVICTSSEALAERLGSVLEHWALSECVHLTVARAERLPLPEDERASCCFWTWTVWSCRSTVGRRTRRAA